MSPGGFLPNTTIAGDAMCFEPILVEAITTNYDGKWVVAYHPELLKGSSQADQSKLSRSQSSLMNKPASSDESRANSSTEASMRPEDAP